MYEGEYKTVCFCKWAEMFGFYFFYTLICLIIFIWFHYTSVILLNHSDITYLCIYCLSYWRSHSTSDDWNYLSLTNGCFSYDYRCDTWNIFDFPFFPASGLFLYLKAIFLKKNLNFVTWCGTLFKLKLCKCHILCK